MQTLLGHHVGADVAELALEGELGSEQREATALFIDVIGSTAMAEHLPPADVVGRLNDLFAAVVRVVSDEGGLVNKFDGDGALCVFGAPDHPARSRHPRACRAARALRAEVVRLGLAHEGLDAGIGVASGAVVAGRVGADDRYEYTVLGRPVNAAARLTDLAKGRASRVLAVGGHGAGRRARRGRLLDAGGRGRAARCGRAGGRVRTGRPAWASSEPARSRSRAAMAASGSSTRMLWRPASRAPSTLPGASSRNTAVLGSVMPSASRARW